MAGRTMAGLTKGVYYVVKIGEVPSSRTGFQYVALHHLQPDMVRQQIPQARCRRGRCGNPLSPGIVLSD